MAEILDYALTDGVGNYGGSLSRGSLALLLSGQTTAQACDFGLGIELLHHATLCVDDLVDLGVSRREKLAVWRRFSRESAVLLSHYLTNRSQGLFAANLSSENNAQASTLVEKMVSAELQIRTQLPKNLIDYSHLVSHKTGALYAIAGLGITLNPAVSFDPLILTAFEDIGSARQIRDDLADAAIVTHQLFLDPAAHQRDMERAFGLGCKLLALKNDLVVLQHELAESALRAISAALVNHPEHEPILGLLRMVAYGTASVARADLVA
ncbi:MAG: polyprenyl synthetase family protein [Elusimicrobia bacterium]|nr:polyprenyl synthetase family protein [Elusimicrobiota bacterium]